jgi:hypothetical protein
MKLGGVAAAGVELAPAAAEGVGCEASLIKTGKFHVRKERAL